jgi:hypothetical protein
MLRTIRIVAIAIACSLEIVLSPFAIAVDGTQIRFERKQLDDKFRSEGVAVGDFNHDGKPDIAAGSVWFVAPDWKMNLIAAQPAEFNLQGSSNSFEDFSDDLNHDGWADLIVVDLPGQKTIWFENPQGASGPWKQHLCTPVSNNESPQYLDCDGDGKRELLMGTTSNGEGGDGPNRFMALLRPQDDPYQPWRVQQISAKAAPGTNAFVHGLGAGDLNGDGRMDIVVPMGWWEAPVEPQSTAEWKHHPPVFDKWCAHMVIYDFDGDGDADIACSSAHDIGVWWLEQTKEGWTTHEIDTSYSQTHSMWLADINSDGLPDLVTGKRWWAHGQNGDVQPNNPAVLFWYELRREGGKPIWIPHEVDHDSGIGTQFEVADVNRDGLLDIVTANKKGIFYFQQVRPAVAASQ